MSASFSFVDYYAVLGLPRNAGHQDINNAYKRLALLYHPDKAGNDEATIDHFRQIQEAVDVLRSPGQRLQYDEMYDEIYELDAFDPLAPRARDYNSRRWRERRRQWEIPTRNNPSTPKDPWLRSMDSQNIDQRYMYTHGHSVHMNPNSEESMLETARWVNELEEWEHEWAGIGLEEWTIDPRLSTSSEEACPGGMAAQCDHNEAEQQDQQLSMSSNDGCQEDTEACTKRGGRKIKATAEEEQLLNRLERMTVQFKRDETEMEAGAGAGTERLASHPKGREASCKREDVEVETEEQKERKKVEREENDASIKRALITAVANEGRFRDWSDIGNNVHSPILCPSGDDVVNTGLPCLSVVDNIHSCRSNYLTGIENVINFRDMSDGISSPRAHQPSDGEGIANSRPEPKPAAEHVVSAPHGNNEEIESSTSLKRSEPEREASSFELPPHITQHLQEKLAANNIHYTAKESHEEIAGILLTIWDDIMGKVSRGMAGVPDSAQNDPDTCQHVVAWELELHHESCRNCGFWRPLLVLRCPTCSLQTCVRCRWFSDSPSAT